jgi:hypothetical protein
MDEIAIAPRSVDPFAQIVSTQQLARPVPTTQAVLLL